MLRSTKVGLTNRSINTSIMSTLKSLSLYLSLTYAHAHTYTVISLSLFTYLLQVATPDWWSTRWWERTWLLKKNAAVHEALVNNKSYQKEKELYILEQLEIHTSHKNRERETRRAQDHYDSKNVYVRRKFNTICDRSCYLNVYNNLRSSLFSALVP